MTGTCMTERIVVIDDEEDIRELIEYNLSKEGFDVRCAMSAEDGIALIRREPPDMIILDLMLPGRNGLDLCRELKSEAEYKDIPIIMVTARSEESDIVKGLELGADDYVSKPFSPKVLNARVKSVLRRGRKDARDASSTLTFEGLILNPERHEVTIDDGKIDLTNTEFKLLHFLLRHPGYVFTRDQIVEGVHGDDYPVTDRSVDVQVAGLRKKLLDYGAYVETVRGVGYRFKG